MTRLMLITMLALGAGAANAEILTQFEHNAFLRSYETIRYRIDIDYGSNNFVDIDVEVRGFSGPPRVRVLDTFNKELLDERDTSGDWSLDFDFVGYPDRAVYFIEVDCANPAEAADIGVLLTVNAQSSVTANARVTIDKYYFDHESDDPSDHYDCAANPRAGLWALAPFAGLAALTLRRRRAA